MTGARKRRVVRMLRAFPERYRGLCAQWRHIQGADEAACRARVRRREALSAVPPGEWREFAAVWRTICLLWGREQGESRLSAVGHLYWGGCTLEGAALKSFCHRATASRWNQEFLSAVEKEAAEPPGAAGGGGGAHLG